MMPSVGARLPPASLVDYVVGVDLGQSNDYTTIAVIRRRYIEAPRFDAVTFGWQVDIADRALVMAERLPLQMPYPEICARLAQVDQRLKALGEPAHFYVDKTGGGVPVVDFLRGGLGGRLHGVTFTGGLATTGTKRDPNVPKVHLISWLMADVQGGELVFAAGLPFLDVLERELLGMQARHSGSGKVTMSAGTTGVHDDLVCGVALANYGARELPLGKQRQGRII